MNNKSKDLIKLSVPNKPEYVGVIRLTVTGIANRMGFDIEKMEDIKVAISEACTNAITHGICQEENNFSIEFLSDEEKLVISVSDNGKGCLSQNIKPPVLEDPREGGLGVFIIRSLMDEVEILSNNGKGTIIKMTKYVGDDI
ncbi:serine/threonine-protein kinase RsbW [Natronincola peptidivorans]|uniref:Serine/threonine-protein kinase RsbW n=1 Tax=Natronincola peptidivorans TaxID=426128 RepID=A0A1I0GN74_9FIRM|nr:ATP-binding protein [Natronincola peptidivorans]SET72378.1 serine/threonine-protein kinase RsbW [Natronincola peptidivorans]